MMKNEKHKLKSESDSVRLHVLCRGYRKLLTLSPRTRIYNAWGTKWSKVSSFLIVPRSLGDKVRKLLT